MSTIRTTLLACCMTLALPAHAASPAHGHAGGWEVADALAYRDKHAVYVVFSDRQFDRAAIAGDRKLDSFDIMNHESGPPTAHTYTIRIDEDGTLGGVTVPMPGGSSMNYTSEMAKGLTLSRNEQAAIAGTFTYGDARLTFDLPITSGELARPGKALPADGGEPGQILLAQVKAIHGNDFDTMLRLSPPQYREPMLKSKAAGKAQLEIDAVKKLTPTNVHITGGSIEGDHAWLDFTGEQRGAKVTGTATIERTAGAWYVRNLDIHDAG